MRPPPWWAWQPRPASRVRRRCGWKRRRPMRAPCHCRSPVTTPGSGAPTGNHCWSRCWTRNARPASGPALFHATLAQAALEQARALRAETGISRIGLTGGVFQNRRLTEGLAHLADGRRIHGGPAAGTAMQRCRFELRPTDRGRRYAGHRLTEFGHVAMQTWNPIGMMQPRDRDGGPGSLVGGPHSRVGGPDSRVGDPHSRVGSRYSRVMAGLEPAIHPRQNVHIAPRPDRPGVDGRLGGRP